MGPASAWLLALLVMALPAGADGGAGADAQRAEDEPSACVERAVEAIQRRYGSLRDLRARFVQETRSVALGGASSSRATRSRGTVVLAKPGKMRWSYEAPEESLVVSDGSTLWIYDPARGEAQRFTVGEGYLSGAAIHFLLGEGDLRREFDLEAQSCPASYERLHVRADPATGHLLATQVIDLVGNVTSVEFSEIRVNLDPPAESFRFDPPSGVRVIELEAPAGGGPP
jgi:outer membrane lipoprotein carrier protein